MTDLIYQYWDGNVQPSARAGSNNMKRYADRIGVEYMFEENPRYFKNAPLPHYGAFKPVFDKKFDKYDNILFADTDIFAVEGLEESIFDGFSGDVGMAEEPLQPGLRNSRSSGNSNKNTEKNFEDIVKGLGGTPIKNSEGYNKVYNSGVVLYSKEGRQKCRKVFMDFNKYVRIAKSRGLAGVYLTDQNYLQAMVMKTDIEFFEIDSEWNSCITWAPQSRERVVDSRTDRTKFVHIQMRGADNLPGEQLERIANLPVEEWGTNHKGLKFRT